MPLEEPSTVMRQAQYKVCLDFIHQLKNGCPGQFPSVYTVIYNINNLQLSFLEVTAAIAEYPALIDVIKAMLQSPGVSSTLSGKYTLKGYAEKQLVRTCMTMDVLQQ